MPVRFLISTLKPGVDPAEYEQWVRERDYALVRTLPNYVSYQVHRISGPIAGAADAGWQYIERIEVKSLEQHDRDLASPAGVARVTMSTSPSASRVTFVSCLWPVPSTGCVRRSASQRR